MDSADCHSNASACIAMANRATERREQSLLFELARSWMMLGWELEGDPDLRDAVKNVSTFTRSLRTERQRRGAGDEIDCRVPGARHPV